VLAVTICGKLGTHLSRTRVPKDLNSAKLSLRPAEPADYDFATELYLDSMKRLLSALGTWHEIRVLARFRQGFKVEQTRVIQWDGVDIGWMQVSETAKQRHLHQLHIIAEFRNRGIGTWLIRSLLDQAAAARQAVALNVVRGNPALSLYRRLGFQVVGGDGEKHHMRWEAKSP